MTIDDMQMATLVRSPQVADWALSHGIGAMTTAQVAELLRVPSDQVRRRLAVPVRRGEWVAPARGLWIPVRPEHRAVGGPPGVELVDDLATHLGFGYYVGWLSAAAHYGAAHHAPQVFQVATSTTVLNRDVGRVRMRFHRRSRVGLVPTIAVRTYGGDVPHSTPAVTALDVATDLTLAGGLDNAANVIIDLVTEAGLTPADIAEAAQWFPTTSARRVGWLIETFVGPSGLDPLRQVARVEDVPPSLLHPAYPRRGSIDPRWALCLNTKADPDT
ncbi:MAG: type IV toxin-antitoxin system AbiEi family antitoxin [Micrococcales bacterium]|nr:type IV toxin-antitoxin system AbiEi family antitoxin [Micrococcales bacterium]